jgi:hypothetical protein
VIRSAEHAAALYADLIEATESTRSANPGERVRRPKVLTCPKCESRKWKLGAQGKIVCDGGTKRKCKQVWPSEFVSDTGSRGPKGKPPAERAMDLRCTLGLVFSLRPSPNQPPPITRWQWIVLEMHALLGRGIPRDIERALRSTRLEDAPRGRIQLLAFALRVRHPGTRNGAWDVHDVLRLLRAAERRVEARLRWRNLLA